MDNEELKNEEIAKETIEEVNGEIINEEKAKEDSKAIRFLKRVLAGVIDQIISVALALLLLILTDLLLKLFGFYIAEREPMFLIMYIIVNILYGPICASTKLKDTIGRKTMLK